MAKAIPEKYSIVLKQRTLAKGRWHFLSTFTKHDRCESSNKAVRGEVPPVHVISEHGLKFKVGRFEGYPLHSGALVRQA
jgi:hypothetical protein